MSIALEEQQTHTPGLYPDVPLEDYLRWPLVSQSILTVIRDKSPAHARYEQLHPSPSTPAQLVGDSLHRAVLQPDLFAKEFLRGPDGPWNRNPYKAELEEMRSNHPEATILKAEEYDTVLRMRDNVHTHPKISKLLTEDVELSAIWQDRATELMCKGRFDCVNRKRGVFLDLKKTRDASPRGFLKAIGTYGYYLQAAMYYAGAYALDLPVKHFVFVAIEDYPPYAVAAYRITDKALMAAEYELGDLMQVYKECVESGHWPAYSQDIEDIAIPGWVAARIENELEVELI